jgi:hypothetical protein
MFPEKTQADFIIRLKNDDFVTQAEFFREVIYAYLNNDPILLDFIDSVKIQKSKLNKKRNSKNRKLIQDGELIIKDFGLDKDEIENIFDILEQNDIDL